MFLLWGIFLQFFITSSFYIYPCFLTETKLRRLYRRFGHPSAQNLHTIFIQSAYNEVEKEQIDYLNKFWNYCQKNKGPPPPKRFRFNIQENDIQFNHSIIFDRIYSENHPILHIIDDATCCQAARWLKNITAKYTWNKIRACWTDVYIGRSEEWQGVFKLINISSETCKIYLPSDPTDFRSTTVRPYFLDNDAKNEEPQIFDKPQKPLRIQRLRRLPTRYQESLSMLTYQWR